MAQGKQRQQQRRHTGPPPQLGRSVVYVTDGTESEPVELAALITDLPLITHGWRDDHRAHLTVFPHGEPPYAVTNVAPFDPARPLEGGWRYPGGRQRR